MKVDHGVELPDVSNLRSPPEVKLYLCPLERFFPQNFMCNRGYHFLPPHMKGRTFKLLTVTVSRKDINNKQGTANENAASSQLARNSCPRLRFSVWSLSCRCRVKFSTQSDQPCRNLSH